MQRIDNRLTLSKGLHICSAPSDVASFPMYKTASVLTTALECLASGIVDGRSPCTHVCRFEDYDELTSILMSYRKTNHMRVVVDFR